MTIVELEALPNGAHRNQTVTELEQLPDGWLVIPEELMDMWEFTAPFADFTVSEGKITAITPKPAPEPDPEPEPVSEIEQRIAELEDAVIELAAIIAGEGE